MWRKATSGGDSAASSRRQVPNRARFGGSLKQLCSCNRPPRGVNFAAAPSPAALLYLSVSALLQAFQILYIPTVCRYLCTKACAVDHI